MKIIITYTVSIPNMFVGESIPKNSEKIAQNFIGVVEENWREYLSSRFPDSQIEINLDYTSTEKESSVCVTIENPDGGITDETAWDLESVLDERQQYIFEYEVDLWKEIDEDE